MSDTVEHVATVAAYPNKDGGYSAAILNKADGNIERKAFESFDEARNWVRRAAWDTFGPGNFAPLRRKGEYRANYWIMTPA
jgi:hypothetical protein